MVSPDLSGKYTWSNKSCDWPLTKNVKRDISLPLLYKRAPVAQLDRATDF